MKNREGFTLVEVIVALALLAIVLVGLQTMTGRFMHIVTTSDRQVAASQLAEDQIEVIRADPEYTELEDRYVGTEDNLAELPGGTRTTTIVQVTDSSETGVADYKRVTVVVDGPGLTSPVARTVSVGRP